MKIEGRVLDGASSPANPQPLPGATIIVTDATYKPLGPGTEADNDGKFTLDAKELDNPNNFVLVSFVEDYQQQILAPAKANGDIVLKFTDKPLKSAAVTAYVRIKNLTTVEKIFWAGSTAAIIIASILIVKQLSPKAV